MNMASHPTVYPSHPFDPSEDAKALKAAFKGWGCDEKSVMSIITKRSNQQRQQITTAFKTMYGKDLIKELKSELKGNFEDVIVALMLNPYEYYAKQLHKALSGLGTDEKTIIEILGINNNQEIIRIREAYQHLYNSSLERDLKSDSSGWEKRLMVSLVTAGRDESGITDYPRAQQDAQSLLRAGELIAGTDEATFNAVMCQRNKNQLRLIFEQYKNITGHDFETAIHNEFSGTIESLLLALVRCIRNPAEYLAHRLHKSMEGMGTDDNTLIRIVVSRSEIDLGDIKNEFLKAHGKSLGDFIKNDTSGDYKHALLSIVGDNY